MFKELKKGEISKVESEYSKFFIEDKILEKLGTDNGFFSLDFEQKNPAVIASEITVTIPKNPAKPA